MDDSTENIFGSSTTNSDEPDIQVTPNIDIQLNQFYDYEAFSKKKSSA